MTETKGAIWTKSIGLLWVDVPMPEEAWHDVSETQRQRAALDKGVQALAHEILEAGAVQIEQTKSGYHLEVAVMVDGDSRQELVTRVRDARVAGRCEALLQAADEAENSSLTHKAPLAVASASFALNALAERLKKMADIEERSGGSKTTVTRSLNYDQHWLR